MKIAFVFPGQGSQSVGMLNDIAGQYSEITQTFDEASEVLGYDLWRLVTKGPAADLDNTVHTQPALLTGAYAIWRIVNKRVQFKPELFAGHSLGEYSALVCASALKFTDAVTLVAARGLYMQEAVKQGIGAMAAIIGLDDETVLSICQQSANEDEVLSPANYNSIGQIVIAGHKTAVDRALSLAKEKGAKLTVMIPVSVPSHCALMRPAAERLNVLLNSRQISRPDVSVINNVDVEIYQDAEQIRDGLVRQLYKPVRWVETVQALVKHGCQTIIECGPGKVLTGLNKRIDKNLQLLPTADLASLDAVLTILETEGAQNV